CITEVVMEMPRCCSMAIQSEVACRSDLRDLTVPATSIALPISSRRSVMVVLPASGWEMIAKVRRFATSWEMVLGMGGSIINQDREPDMTYRLAGIRWKSVGYCR